MCSIQTACHITRGARIEDDVFIGQGVVTLNDTLQDTELRYPVIMKGARIGGGSLILPGITIGENAFVGAGSVVTRDISSGGFSFGNPARARVFGGRHDVRENRNSGAMTRRSKLDANAF